MPRLRSLPADQLNGYLRVVTSPPQLARRRTPLRALPGGGPSTPAPLSDEELISAVQAGEARVAGEVYDRLYAVVDHTLYRVFGRRESDHDDLIQASFEQIIRTLQRQSFAGACSLRTWASTVASHVGLNALRARRRERRVLDRGVEFEPEMGVSSLDPEREFEARAWLEVVRGELAGMSTERAHSVFLHDVLGHDLAEIALITGVSVAAAQSRLVRGRKELEKRLERSRRERRAWL